MMPILAVLLAGMPCSLGVLSLSAGVPEGAEAPASSPTPDSGAGWTIHVLNDNCPDYTWGLDETTTRKAFADIVRAHLDAMARTDKEPPESQDRYNMAVAQEALCFLEQYPDRAGELARRVREGRLYISPFLCNSMWAFHGVEGAVRTMYPARRLAVAWGTPLDVAHHIEEPSLPWGMATVLSGCGIRWLNVPFLKVDSTFGGLTTPPVFAYEGPDGSRLNVVLDSWASLRHNYVQGAALLKDPPAITREWLPHYRALGPDYPWRAILASGTHGDISPRSGDRAPEFAQKIIDYNARTGSGPKLVNATFPMFCRTVDEAVRAGAALPVVRGCFGHSWDLWPVSLAKYAAAMRQGERSLLASEALLVAASRGRPPVDATKADRRRAEWDLAMLSDHAWNGTDDANRKHNAQLRKAWSGELNRLADHLAARGWEAAGAMASPVDMAVFNPISGARSDLVRVAAASEPAAISCRGRDIKFQTLDEEGQRVLYVCCPRTPGFGFTRLKVIPGGPETPQRSPQSLGLKASATELESPFYVLRLNPETGQVESLVHKDSGQELVSPASSGAGLCQTVYDDGAAHALQNVQCEAVASGPVLGRLRVRGEIGEARISVSAAITVYAALDRVDFDVRVVKEPASQCERLCQLFPVLADKAVLRAETTGAVICPRPQPEGDLLPGADTKRVAVQGFVDASLPDGPGVTIAPLDAFMLRLDGGSSPITFEALGNDQNYKEVSRGQNGETEFRFRYAVRGHRGPYDPAEAFAFARSAASPMMTVLASLPDGFTGQAVVEAPGDRAIATCLKPADDESRGGAILRLWEVAGKSDPLPLRIRGFQQAFACDLLERDRDELPVKDGVIDLPIRPHGMACVRLLGPR